MILHGDCIDVMVGMDAESVDAVVTDPPYAFPGGFMSKAWDRFDGPPLDVGFLHWFAGFVDGEGCFSVHKKPQDTFDCQFSITLRADDRPILERIHRTLGIGTLSKPTAHATGEDNPKARYSVSSKGDCVRLRDIFREFPLRAKKALDFEEWSKALDAWLQHETGEWSDMAASRDRLMASRAFKPEGVRVDPYQLWTIRWARQAYRLLKPGGWLIAAGAPKRVHRMTAGLEDAGFEIRDMILHCFASGFPKGKANLKPAYEPWVLARKPGPLRMLAIDLCRIGVGDEPVIIRATEQPADLGTLSQGPRPVGEIASANPAGRWPANVILTDPIFDGGVEGVVGGGETSIAPRQPAGYRRSDASPWSESKGMFTPEREWQPEGYGDSGTYSRFFLIPKADRSDREPVLGGLPLASRGTLNEYARPSEGRTASKNGSTPRANVHPTVKPTELMRHLVRLVTPAGGTVLDCFAGSGSTLIAAEQEGFQWVGIEREREYVDIIEARLNGVQRGLGLDLPPVATARREGLSVVGVDPQLLLGMAGPTESDEVA